MRGPLVHNSTKNQESRSVLSPLRTLAPEPLLGGLKYLQPFQIGPTHPDVPVTTWVSTAAEVETQ